ncbi:MAG: restriction endonuclease subunit S [Candidatus Omnitrophica bacterium]|nr:restriction endonuclease subunit S [Candidatus Omnitrophota bacterium]MBU1128053.1 restriction endonuclease subunit S [Candidatus Omnitrophota bacterium]MBU1851051.1 restriction endonuclease subunit S [Candidatus Omnitrophota bacterium]
MHKRYSQYKDLGIEWIGEIPAHWNLIKLKHIANIVTGTTPSMKENDNYSTQGLMWVKPDNLKEFDPTNRTKAFLSDKGEQAVRPIPRRMPLVCCIGDVGKFGFAEEKVATNQQINAIVFRKDINIKFGLYLTAISSSEWKSLSNTNVIPILNSSRQGLIVYAIPSREEQDSIVFFLDRKTLQIDELIYKKERMIELLKEERTAIINHAVTKGLDPDVEMKDSGIEWLGEISKLWEVKKLKFNSSVRFSNVDKKSNEGELDVDLCNYTDVYYNDIITLKLDFMKATASVEEIRKFQLNIGDTIVTKDSESWDDIAVPAYVVETKDNLLCGYHLAQIKPNTRVLSGKFLFWMLSGNAFNYQYKVESSGVTRYGLGNYALSNSFVVLPSIVEQEKIVAYLDKKTVQIHDQINREERSIELLKEYRTALISEVVTGKIDVRGE